MKGIVDPGLESVVAAQTRLSEVHGQAGELTIAGYPVEQFAPVATFEEATFLLWYGRLPDAAELSGFEAKLASLRVLPEQTVSLLRGASERGDEPMDALRSAIASLNVARLDATQQQVAIVSQASSIIAAYERLTQGLEPVPPRGDLRHTSNLLFMIEGETPAESRVRALETYLNTVVDHGLNASTFTARVIASTRSDCLSAITGAVVALKRTSPRRRTWSGAGPGVRDWQPAALRAVSSLGSRAG